MDNGEVKVLTEESYVKGGEPERAEVIIKEQLEQQYAPIVQARLNAISKLG